MQKNLLQNKKIMTRIEKLRESMKRQKIDAYIVLNSDPHLSEYLPAYWKSREWFSGFDGSAGSLVVTQDFAGLWTDSRYWGQAEYQLSGTGIELMKAVGGQFLSLTYWLVNQLKTEQVVAADGAVISLMQGRQLEESLQKARVNFRNDCDLVAEIWDDRPSLPVEPLYEHEAHFVSASRVEKLSKVREKMSDHSADWHFISTLDDIAWLFNLRGSDVQFNPVFISYALLGKEQATLFVDIRKVSHDLKQKLLTDGIELKPYEMFSQALQGLPDGSTLLLDPRHSTSGILNLINKKIRIVEEINPSILLKAQKGELEINCIRSAMEQDGAALCECFAWLEAALQKKKEDALTEIIVSEKMAEFRAKAQGYVSLSFTTIVGFNENGALPHYHPTSENYAVIEGDGLLLIDSGAQYFGGTTDITRVIPIGHINEQQKHDYTYVLKALIALSTAQFPRFIRAPMIDAIARAPLWAKGLDYGHGTGHGIGYFLNVHEPPQSISYHAAPDPHTAMEVGMITSIEPALYRKEQWGIRLENLAVTQESQITEFGEYLRFETLTLCPLDTRCIELSLLSSDEIKWLNQYHQIVRDRLLPHLSESARAWMLARTEPI